MRRILRIILTIAVLSVLGVVGAVAVQNAQSSSAPDPDAVILEETTVEQGDLTVTVSATGVLAPARQVPLFFEATVAPVAQILVQEGDYVTAGQLLASLNAVELEEAVNDAELVLEAQQAAYDALTAPPRDVDVAAAEAAVDAAEASVNAAFATAPTDAQIEIARLQAEIARNQLWQLQIQRDTVAAYVDSLPPGLPPESYNDADQLMPGLNQADYNVQIADVNYEGALNAGPDVGQLAAANAQLIQAQIALERLINGPTELELQRTEIEIQRAELAVEQARASLARTQIVAPFDGIVAEMNLTLGELPPQDPAILFIDTTSYYVDVSVDEIDIVSVQVGQLVNLTFDALPSALVTGSITNLAVTPTRVGQLVTYAVRVTLDPTTEAVRIGMSATASIQVNQLTDVLLLRNRFIRIDRATGRAFATIQNEDGTFQEVEIVLGLRNDTYSQVVNGLSIGQRVVLVPRDALNPLGF
jgi:HlyD family secretion protein